MTSPPLNWRDRTAAARDVTPLPVSIVLPGRAAREGRPETKREVVADGWRTERQEDRVPRGERGHRTGRADRAVAGGAAGRRAAGARRAEGWYGAGVSPSGQGGHVRRR